MRTESLKNLRPSINATIEQATPIERFQNETLRPILKFQNDLLKSTMLHYLEKRKGEYYKLAQNRKNAYLEHAIRQDLRFKSQLLGTIIGLFTVEEFVVFTQQEAEITRRITDLLVQRITSEFNPPTTY